MGATVQVGLPRSDFGKAVRYMLERWTGLTRFVDDPRIALDNNAAERAVRPCAVGRKNWLFCGNDGGGRTAAILFSMTYTDKRHGLDPFAWIREVLSRLPGLSPMPSDDQLLPLLPRMGT